MKLKSTKKRRNTMAYETNKMLHLLGRASNCVMPQTNDVIKLYNEAISTTLIGVFHSFYPISRL